MNNRNLYSSRPHVLDRVFAHFGTQKAVADALGLKAPAVSRWRQIPIHHVHRVSELTGIPPHELRPDVFRESKAA